MWNTKLCLATSPRYGISEIEQIDLYKKIGFDGFFVNWNANVDIARIREHADAVGMYFQSIHAPFGKISHMWEQTELTEKVLQEQLACLADCVKNQVPVMVCHAFIGFTKHEPTALGIENFGRVVEAARGTGVKIAFENTEGEEYLFALMDAFRNEPHVGFCWDTGHEMCYNHHQDLLEKFGDRLFATHLNDNLGIKDTEGKITFHDDLHLLPFDGIADWQDIADRLNRHNFTQCLTFELKHGTTLNGCDHLIYGDLDLEGYTTQAYIRACRLAALVRKYGK